MSKRRYRPDMPEWFSRFVENIRTMEEGRFETLLSVEGATAEGMELFDMIKKDKSISLSTYSEKEMSPEQQAEKHSIDLGLYYPTEIRTKLYHQGSKLTINGVEQVIVTPLHYLSVKWGLKKNSAVITQEDYISTIKEELSIQILNSSEKSALYISEKEEVEKKDREELSHIIKSIDAEFIGEDREAVEKKVEDDIMRTFIPKYGVEIMLTDLHLGKVGFDPITLKHNWSLHEAADHVLDAIDNTIRKVGVGNIDHFILPLGNDYLNIDSTANTTTAGTPQMTNEFWFNIFKFGKELAIMAIETLNSIAPVFVYMVNGNHDNDSVFTLGEVLDSYFQNDDNVSIVNDMLRHPGHVFG